MKLWAFIRSIRPKQFWRLLKLCLGNLSNVWPTWRATKESISFANNYYGTRHHKNTPANGFRHALWNCLIVKKCLNNSEQWEDVMLWTEKITDLHEELFPNSALARAMDLHNNAVGRAICRDHMHNSITEIAEIIYKMAQDSLLVTTIRQLETVPKNILVYIEEFALSEK